MAGRVAGRDAGGGAEAAPGDLTGRRTLSHRLAFRTPLEPSNLFGHLAATGVPGVEQWLGGAYRRTVRLPHGPGIVAVRPPPPGQDWVDAELTLTDPDDLSGAVAGCRRMLDLDVDPVTMTEALGADPHLAAEVARAPGRRVPRTVDGDELAVRAVLGQQVSTAAARTHAARLVRLHGQPVHDPVGGLTHLFPTTRALTEVDPDSLGMPKARRRTFAGLVAALADGSVDLSPGTDPAAARSALLALPGIGPWTADTVTMRALGDPDVFLAGDLGIRAVARALGLPDKEGPLAVAARRWSPWRSYAVQYLWATLDHPVNTIPADPAPSSGPSTPGTGPAGDVAAVNSGRPSRRETPSPRGRVRP